MDTTNTMTAWFNFFWRMMVIFNSDLGCSLEDDVLLCVSFSKMLCRKRNKIVKEVEILLEIMGF